VCLCASLAFFELRIRRFFQFRGVKFVYKNVIQGKFAFRNFLGGDTHTHIHTFPFLSIALAFGYRFDLLEIDETTRLERVDGRSRDDRVDNRLCGSI